ncbi:MAG: NAD(P)H-hydrate epimerase [Mariniblastus sp.]|nr:NAD(P)H-hydrate epimerase [Mariniblastus sp.]
MAHPNEKPNSRHSDSLTRRQSRLVDRLAIENYGIPSMVLMENAGRGCCVELRREGCRGPVVVLCGSGNNGGDGLVIARHLAVCDIKVSVLLMGARSRFRGEAAVNLEIADRLGLPVVSAEQLTGRFEMEASISRVDGTPTEWVVDAVLGTGGQGPPRGLAAKVIRVSNQTGVRRMAVDMPSGMDCDTGQLSDPTFQADMTCTMVAAKRGFSNPDASDWLGDVRVIDIGVDSRLLLNGLEEIA